MTAAEWLFDGALALALPILAACLVLARSLRVALTLFIAFGLLSALVWAELGAVDVALVEAALGTGLTGALLLSSLAWADESAPPPMPTAIGRASLLLALAASGLFAAWSVHDAGSSAEGLTALILATMDRSGVGHPVTAVLLNFRGYDTLLEVAVLLVAAVAVRWIQPSRTPREGLLLPNLLAAFVSLLVPVGVLVAGYFVWRGSDAPGGAFQAAAILAGCAVVLVVSGRIRAPGTSLATRSLLLVGPGLFVVTAGVPLLGGAHMLEYPRSWAGAVMLVVETALAISIAVILTTFFPPTPNERDGGRHTSRGAS